MALLGTHHMCGFLEPWVTWSFLFRRSSRAQRHSLLSPFRGVSTTTLKKAEVYRAPRGHGCKLYGYHGQDAHHTEQGKRNQPSSRRGSSSKKGVDEGYLEAVRDLHDFTRNPEWKVRARVWVYLELAPGSPRKGRMEEQGMQGRWKGVGTTTQREHSLGEAGLGWGGEHSTT